MEKLLLLPWMYVSWGCRSRFFLKLWCKRFHAEIPVHILCRIHLPWMVTSGLEDMRIFGPVKKITEMGVLKLIFFTECCYSDWIKDDKICTSDPFVCLKWGMILIPNKCWGKTVRGCKLHLWLWLPYTQYWTSRCHKKHGISEDLITNDMFLQGPPSRHRAEWTYAKCCLILHCPHSS